MKKYKKIIFVFLALLIIGGSAGAFFIYKWIYQSNVLLNGKKSVVIFIPTGSEYQDVVEILGEQQIIKNMKSFEWVAKEKKYSENVKPGRYRILANMSNTELINMLRSGNQEPVQVTFSLIRTKEELAGRVGGKIEADSAEILDFLNNEELLQTKFGLSKKTILTLFIPNTYEFYWNTSAQEFLERMAKEYKKFWTDERKQKAKQAGLSQSEVSILASIVQEEQRVFDDEKRIIAGLYINRLNKNILLQSDPTVIYAIGNFSINRVLKKDLEIDSPYNTYKYSGLPPGPICIPEISSIDAVLNYEKSDYLYMCAKEDFSGRHNFSKTLEQHNIYAKKFQQALNKRNIKR
jgi:UPF0755 protein